MYSQNSNLKQMGDYSSLLQMAQNTTYFSSVVLIKKSKLKTLSYPHNNRGNMLKT